jgi:ATP/maltotriose-dependent transcriptional regulator MalT
MPLALPLKQLRILSAYTDGWIGGLQLIGLSLQGKESAGSFTEALNTICHTTSDYLINEVINISRKR